MELKKAIIAESHRRSEKYGIKKDMIHSQKIIKGSDLQDKLHKHKEFINIAKPYIDMVSEAVQDENFIIILTDEDGCILYIKGDEEIRKRLNLLDIRLGACMDEESIGTNAMGTAIKENRYVQITAEEHYVNIFKGLTCSAAPIHNLNGEIIGTLNLTGKSVFKHPHTLGLVIFGVKAIENELDKIKVNDILGDTYTCTKAIIDNLENGLMIVDINGKVIDINKLACEYFGADKSLLLGDDVKDIIQGWDSIISKLSCKKMIINKEFKLRHNTKYITQFELKGIYNRNKLIGISIIMKNQKERLDNEISTGAFYDFDDIIGDSDAILNLKTNSKIIANSPSTILIQGESGTGKEVIAQAIHNYSHRRNNKFIAINCSAIPNSIFESELFGYEDGTFTGAKKGGKPGKFEAANGGTLFLDEIGEMPLEMQVKLLRVIQEGRVTRVGGIKEIQLDVRIIAATNRDLKIELEKGTFREDLYYRLCVIPLIIPPLRERRGDVEKLIEFFLTVKGLKLNKKIPKIENELYNKLLRYSWPGNIRQLENYIENIVNLEGELSFDLVGDCNVCDREVLEEKEIVYSEAKKENFNLEDIQKDIIKKAIKFYNNNMSKVAKELGISRNTLYLKIKKYDIKIE